ncbi:hypothetical protein [Enterobacter bugandensis]|uniref:hypothetical protein n=1 Tax=Enterobacter bugandensis TaxID=881260 RepID=UPI0038738C2F
MTFSKEQLIARINQVTAINKYRISREQDADGLAMDNELFSIALTSLEAEPAPASVPDDVSGPLAHAYKELTPTFMRNHIDVFERYGIYPDGSAGIQAMRIALDGMNRRAAMLNQEKSNG